MKTAWMTESVCAQLDPELFFKDNTPHQLARDACAECPVRARCLEYALTEHLDFGFWGGMTARERARMAPQPA